MRGLKTLLAGAAVALAVSGVAHATDPIPYPTPGVVNPVTYTFTATSTGHVVAYFVDGGGAAFDNQLSLLINGAPTAAGFGLDNHSSLVGDSFDLGAVTAGDTLTFVMRNFSLGGADVFSDPAMNTAYDNIGAPPGAAFPGINHIYATPYTANPVIPTQGGNPALPLGTYVAFEDIPLAMNPDFNYRDEAFIFTNVTPHGGIPEPATWVMMILGFSAARAMLRRARGLAKAG